jgi:phosphoglycerate-specific signal transduction histidine kinase
MSAAASAGKNVVAKQETRLSGAVATLAQSGAEAASDFNPMAVLLHELNQPLTGLQCSLELATVGSRTAEQYLRALREGLDLVGRMRTLVEALREVADSEHDGAVQDDSVRPEPIALDSLVRSAVEDLQPVAESRSLQIDLAGDSFPRVCMARRTVASIPFRIIDSTLGLAAGHSILRIRLDTQSQHAAIHFAWIVDSDEADRRPFSKPVLALLVARALWQQAGGQWRAEITLANHSITLLLPWAANNNDHSPTTSLPGDRP